MNKKEQVIETARRLFANFGFKKVSMDEIANTSHVTKKTIYTYFKDKEEMFNYFLDEEFEAMKKDVAHIETSKIPFAEKIEKSIMAMLKYRKNSIFLKSNLENPEILNHYDQNIIKFIEEKLKLAQEKKFIKECDAHLTSFIIYRIFISVLFEYDGEIDDAKVTKEIISILQNGLLN